MHPAIIIHQQRTEYLEASNSQRKKIIAAGNNLYANLSRGDKCRYNIQVNKSERFAKISKIRKSRPLTQKERQQRERLRQHNLARPRSNAEREHARSLAYANIASGIKRIKRKPYKQTGLGLDRPTQTYVCEGCGYTTDKKQRWQKHKALDYCGLICRYCQKQHSTNHDRCHCESTHQSPSKDAIEKNSRTWAQKIASGFMPKCRAPHYQSTQGIFCHGSWELKFAEYCHKLNIPIERCKNKFDYFFKGVQKKYTPDFTITLGANKYIVEIKGYLNEKDAAKYKYTKDKILWFFDNDLKNMGVI